MDKSSESLSDSDSASSTSWVLVNDATVTSQNKQHTFHLDCSREPIQELTEQDLTSASSDLDYDTDGISIISESEVLLDTDNEVHHTNFDNSKNSTKTIVKHDVNETSEKITSGKNEDDPKIELPHTTNSLYSFAIGFVITAFFTALYNNNDVIINPNNSQNDEDVQKNSMNKDMGMLDCNNIQYYDNNNMGQEFEYIIDLTISCVFVDGYKDVTSEDSVVRQQIQKCVNLEYMRKKCENKYFNEPGQSAYPKKTNAKEHENNKKMKVKQTRVHGSAKQLHYRKKQKMKDSTVNKNQHVKKQKDMKIRVKKQKEMKIKNKKKTPKFEHFKKIDKNQKYKEVNRGIKKYELKHKAGKLNYTNDHRQSGEWYNKIHKAREDIRKQEHISDWVFDRALSRNSNRNKAQRYFKGMNTREQMRYKHNYKPYSS